MVMEKKSDKFMPKLSQPEPFAKLNETFGIEGAITTFDEPREYPVVNSEEYPVTTKEREDDFSTVRATLHRILQKAENSLDDLAVVAKGSEHPRSYEVVSTLINTVTDITTKIIDLHDKKNKLDGNKSENTNIESQTNIVFNGSSTELLKAIRENREKVINGN
jgi:hypothetical protein